MNNVNIVIYYNCIIIIILMKNHKLFLYKSSNVFLIVELKSIPRSKMLAQRLGIFSIYSIFKREFSQQKVFQFDQIG